MQAKANLGNDDGDDYDAMTTATLAARASKENKTTGVPWALLQVPESLLAEQVLQLRPFHRTPD